MEQIIHFEQFYYTNYGQGMRFEGSSDRRLEEELKLLAGSWMETDTDFPVETIAYNDNLNSYVAALVVPCSKVGDIRGSYWIHAVLPKSNKDGFLECLSWPLENYQQEVALRQTLS